MLVDNIYVGEHKPWSALPRGVFRMSSADHCTRRAGYQYLKYPEDEESDPGYDDFRSVVLEEGNLQEVEVVRRIQETGVKVWNFGQGQTWTVLRIQNQFWRGHPDLFVEIEGVTYGIEIKSTTHSLFEKYANAAEEVLPGRFILHDQTILHEATFPYMGQIQMYLHSEKAVEQGIEQWILVVKNRDSGAILECVIDKDPEYLQAIVDRWKNFWTLMLVERLPDRNFTRTSQQCSFCPFAKRCWGALWEVKDKKVVVDEENEELIKAAQLWREGKRMEKSASLRIDWAKLQFENLAIKEKANRLSVDELDVIISERERSGLDTERVRALLSNLLENDVITPEEAEECEAVTKYIQMNIKDKRVK